jgi:hypothetical protein
MDDKRLCIDVRAASEFAARGLMAQEIADQLIASESEPGRGNYPIVLAHPDQAFPGGPRRHDTRVRLWRTPLHWLWERRFQREQGVAALHRFRPVDRLTPYPDCPAITTLLPARRRLPFFLSHRTRHLYVVPSASEARLVEKSFGVPVERIAVVRPGVRRFVGLMPGPSRPPEGWALFLVGRGAGRGSVKRWLRVLSARFPELRPKVVRLKDRSDFSPLTWIKLLQQTGVCIYLAAQHFDWPTLALEAIYYRVPTLFADDHAALAELLPGSPLRISSFLVEHPDAKSLLRATEDARERLFNEGIFEPFAQLDAYRALHQQLGELG